MLTQDDERTEMTSAAPEQVSARKMPLIKPNSSTSWQCCGIMGAKEEGSFWRLDLTPFALPEIAMRGMLYIEELSEDVFKHGRLYGAFTLESGDSHRERRAEVAGAIPSLTNHFETALERLGRVRRFAARAANEHGPIGRHTKKEPVIPATRWKSLSTPAAGHSMSGPPRSAFLWRSLT